MQYLTVFLLIIGIIAIASIIILHKNNDKNIMEDFQFFHEGNNNLEKHALEVSSYYADGQKTNCRRKLMNSLKKSYKIIIECFNYIDKEVKEKREILSAAEWLLDNLYLIEKEYKDIRHSMPSKYYKNLPLVSKGIMKGYPRIYTIAVEMISHTDGRIDEKTIETFIKAYEKNTILTSGEIWALPIMIRIALIQNISKITEEIVYAQEEKNKADRAADKIISAYNYGNVKDELENLAKENEVFSSYYVERILRNFRNNGIDNGLVYKYIDEKLELQETNTEKMINLEHQRQAAFRFSLGNSITGIREIEALNWRDSFEKLSYLEGILNKDPAGIYEKMDFESKDYYRHIIENIGKKYNRAESFIGKKLLECAEEHRNENDRPFASHIGYYLLDDGLKELYHKLSLGSSMKIRFLYNIKKHKVLLYIGSIIINTLILSFIFLYISIKAEGIEPLWKYIIGFILAIIPCSEIIISIFNWSINFNSNPRFVPKLELKDGIGEEQKTIVIIPTIINSEKRVHDLVNDMEVYYLANMEKNIYFALLSDFKDSDLKDEPLDKDIVSAALSDIKSLNKKYSSNGEDIFYFFSRFRQFNESQHKWLGYERKRGKIMEFLSLLKGNTNTSYDVLSSSPNSIKDAKYIITLDADTQLPRDTAKKLIGAMAHPLNKAYADLKVKKVLRGYGLIQPRISVSTISANKTMFSKIFSGETGIDVYTTAVSDVYQDVFGEGIFTGKGIFDIDLFFNILNDEIPENTILSHDLLEGSYVRCALATDVELIDGYPAYYNASCKRLHRWVRGDWQLLPWLLKKSSLNAISKWKIIDNLRRSLLSPSIIILIIFSLWAFSFPENFLIITFLSILCPILFDVSEAVVSPIKGISLSGRLENWKMVIEQVFLIFCFLPYQAYLMLDAIIRTLYRVYVSKKNMLEWQTAADAEASSSKKFSGYLREMWKGSILSLLIIILAYLSSFSLFLFMLPSCLIWFLSPLFAYLISRDIVNEQVTLQDLDIKLLRRISRKTFAYFEDFINEDTNYLPPDNYQEDPYIGIAYRTSPTNMGMGLMSSIVGYDLGFLGLYETVDKIDKMLKSMEGLNRLNGHFYNWYDIKTLKPLYPEFISTVDSGNLVGYMWTAAESLIEYKNEKFITKERIKGFLDLTSLAEGEIKENLGTLDYYKNIVKYLQAGEINLISWRKFLLSTQCEIKILEKNSSYNEEDFYWNKKFSNFVETSIDEIERFFPFADLLSEAPKKYENILEEVNYNFMKCTALDLANFFEKILEDSSKDTEEGDFLEEFKMLLKSGIDEFHMMFKRMDNLINKLNLMVSETDFTMLYDKKRQLFSIGYDVEKDIMSNCYYDLLASESRQSSFIAIAKGDVEQKHWFKLGRAMTLMYKGVKGLVSWSGTMFEYFMPLLIMKNYPDTLLNDTYKAVIQGQKNYGKIRRVPWGVSESAFYAFDLNKNYQYKAFGVPGIGLKRGLLNELVISPYSTILAMQIDLKSSLENVWRFVDEKVEGRYGLYEAVDYTRERLEKSKKRAVIKSYMVHHQGMSLMALDNVLNHNVLRERFHKLPLVKATELLLQEKVPKKITFEREQQYELSEISYEKQNIVVRSFNSALTNMHETHLLSNGSYSLMINNSGSGYGKLQDFNLYRWKGDPTSDDSGMFFYIKNINSNEYWSSTYEPCKNEGDYYEVIFSLDKAEFRRKDGNLGTSMEVTVSNEEDAEIRRLIISNHSASTRIIEVTSYLEVTLANVTADLVHPAFSNLFVKTMYIDNPSCIIATRRPRDDKENKKYIMQTVAVDGDVVGTLQYETSRSNFIGRGQSLKAPYVMENNAPLKNTEGAVLDPIISIRRRVKIKPGKSCKIAYTTSFAETKQQALDIAKKYSDMSNVNRIFELALSGIQVEMKYLGIKSPQANLYQHMASKMLYLNSNMKKREEYIKKLDRGQSSLWCFGISGDLPIALLTVSEEEHIDFIRQMLSAHEYWHAKGLNTDLVIINLKDSAYMEPLQDLIKDIISSSHARDKLNKKGGVFLFSRDTLRVEDIDFLKGICNLYIDSKEGFILNQIKDCEEEISVPLLKTEEINYENCSLKFNKESLQLFNGYGGFSEKGHEYVIYLNKDLETPAPWINVISNGKFGFHISERGSTYTWCKNSRENKITPWFNDPVMDPLGEALFLRDNESGKLFSISKGPICDNEEYIVRHGFGYTTFIHGTQGIMGEMTEFVPRSESVKIIMIKLSNKTSAQRKISLTYYADMVMGVISRTSSKYISTYINEEDDYIYAVNPYNTPFKDEKVYLKIVGGEKASFTGNRKEFLGMEGDIKNPSQLKYERLKNNVGAGMDPCIAEEVYTELLPDEEKNFIILFGSSTSYEEIKNNISKYSSYENVLLELKEVKEYWENLLGTFTIKTPDKSMDILMNGWLMYQVISCRFNARTAFYQSGGAYGFRDQLQDSMAISLLDHSITRNHILYSASKQYLEGDVQHWWHPYVDSGIRTRFSDDLLWLPFVTCDYIEKTGDEAILDEQAYYLEDRLLDENEDERYGISNLSKTKSDILEHCTRAIDKALKFGPHNIPLMGSGDWNDGMNTVGNKGKGESVWLGWFLITILKKFIPLLRVKGLNHKADEYEKSLSFIIENIEKNAWDGSWYRRAYFDDGSSLGSIENEECQIDSLSQSWAVISGEAKKERAVYAMDSLQKYLVKEDKGIVLLLTPPFNKSSLKPGYIKSYVPGVRENGGQYTHGAVWVIIAMTCLGHGNEAYKVFNMINPINHSITKYECERYKVEPYVMTADVYDISPHEGRGGWSWYTGAAGWMYKAGLEYILGFKLEKGRGFSLSPCIPGEWEGFKMTYKRKDCVYNIDVIKENIKNADCNDEDSSKNIKTYLDGKVVENGIVPYLDEGIHEVRIII